MMVSLVLPSAAPARLELIDVRGRAVAAREVGGAGPHVVNLGEGLRLPAGIYMIRLVQGTCRAHRARRRARLMGVPLLVSAEWLASHLDDPAVRIADVRWSLLEKDKGRNAYLDAHVPGAVHIDVDDDLASPRDQGPGRHPLPAPEKFAASMSRAGIGPDTHVVAYDFGDGSTAARLWWLLRYHGHEKVSLLDGGMARWKAEGRPLESAVPSYAPGSFPAAPQPGMLVDAGRRRAACGTIPARCCSMPGATERFEGRHEPIDPAAGHIPGARNNPFASNVRSAEDPRFLDAAGLRAKFERLGVDDSRRVISYCGSGINACQNLLALRLAGFDDGLLYEGSWSDWCSVPAREVKTGA
jgi:thiosulfate/3-mercaptopyruvate sulfurtransferase